MKERERNVDAREKHQLAASHLTGDQTHNLGMCPDGEWNWPPFALWEDTNPQSHSGLGKIHLSLECISVNSSKSALAQKCVLLPFCTNSLSVEERMSKPIEKVYQSLFEPSF